jgi:hypothetical protein
MFRYIYSMKILAHLYQDENQNSIASIELPDIPSSSSRINIKIENIDRKFKILHTLFLDEKARTESYCALQRLEETVNENQTYFLLYIYHFEVPKEKIVYLIDRTSPASLCGIPLKDYDSIKIGDLCYGVFDVVVGNEVFASYTAEAIIKTRNNGGITVDRFKKIPPEL